MITMSVLSTQYVMVPVDTTANGAPYNPTADVVQMAFMLTPPGSNPGVSDWKTASWVTTSSGNYTVRCLVGPAGTALAVGNYNVWIKITDNPEVPVQNVGILSIV